MSRWHKATCSTPQVIVERGSPRCTACDSEPDVEGLIRKQKFSGSFTPPPPDEPLGRLNLHWPGSVPYTSANNSAETREASKGENGETAVKPIDSSSSKSSIYPSRLASNEFRLICLTSSTHVDDPIHFDLEVYKNERCPEYEATSYTWAGEDGDGSFCKPIFIGQYWDVLLQTRNCWSMLRSMRPLKRFRMIWVDAICINQEDVDERDAQVSKMSQIYAECRGAYVYLGPDIATLTPGQYPLRRQLEFFNSQGPDTDYVSDDKVNLGRLLQRRYFSRIWVIQELILSRHAAFQVGDIEFWMNSTTIASISSHSSLDWAKTGAPWLEHLGQRSFQNRDLLQILYMTSKSHCTDPRDKIYGILSLVGASQVLLRANYKLSCQHVFFGTCAHILLNLKNTIILRQALAMNAWGRHPSWLPNLKSEDSRWSFQLPNSKDRTWEEISFQAWRSQQEGKVDSRFYHLSAEPRRWLSDEEASSQGATGAGATGGAFTTPALGKERSAQLERPWYQGATIDAATGALSVNLVYLHAFRSSPIQVAGSDELRFFKVQSTPVSMYLSAETALDKHIQPGRDHLFILDQGDSACLFLILSKVGGNKAFRLLTSCHHVTFEVPKGTPLTPFGTSSLPRSGTRRSENSLFVVDLQHSLHQVLQTVDLSRSFDQDRPQLLKLFPKYRKRNWTGVSRDFDILHVCQGLFNELKGSAPVFLDSYVHCIPKEFAPRTYSDRVELDIGMKVMAGFFQKRECMEIYEEWMCECGECESYLKERTCEGKGKERAKEDIWPRRGLIRKLIQQPERLQKWEQKRRQPCKGEWVKGDERLGSANCRGPLRLRASKSVLQKAVEDTHTFQDLSKLSRAVPKTKETEAVMARRGPDQQTGEDRFVAIPRWPKHILDSLDVDGSTVRVTIE